MIKLLIYAGIGFWVGRKYCELKCQQKINDASKKGFDEGYKTAQMKDEIKDYLDENGKLKMEADNSSKIAAQKIIEGLMNGRS